MPLDDNSQRDREDSHPPEQMTEEQRARAWWSVAYDGKSRFQPREAEPNDSGHVRAG